jgi:hypothetical protein
LFKVGHYIDREWLEHTFPKRFFIQRSDNRSPRIIAGVQSGDTLPFRHLTLVTEGPYYLLYVLHTPRGEGERGRYQSPLLNTGQIEEFLTRFGTFLTRDARFDLWSHSLKDAATLVWDRHDYLYAYGPLEQFRAHLLNLGYEESDDFCVPSPHDHYYHAELDEDAAALLNFFQWSRSPLQPSDEQ